MASKQIDLPKLAQTVASAYDASIDLTLPNATRLRFQVNADNLSARFDLLAGRWFDDATAQFKDASKTLSDALDAMEKPLDNVANAIAALGFLKSLATALDSVLGLLG